MPLQPSIQVHSTPRGDTLVITMRDDVAPSGLVRLLHVEQHPAMCDQQRCQRLLAHWQRTGLVQVGVDVVSTIVLKAPLANVQAFPAQAETQCECSTFPGAG